MDQNTDTPNLDGTSTSPQNPPPPKPDWPASNPESARKTEEPIRELHHHYEKKSGFSLARLLFGGLLILIGLAYLGNSFGWFSVNVNIWQLWPVLIVLVGLSILSRHGWIAWVVGTLVTIIILGGVAYMFFSNQSVGTLTTDRISIDRAAATTASKVDISIGAGKLTLRGGSEKFIDGTFESNVTGLTKTESLSNTTQEIDLEMRGQWRGFRSTRNELELELSKDLPTDLFIDSGAMDMQLDMTEVMLQRLSIDTGASNLDLDLGDLVALSEIQVKAGASSVNISVPRTVGVKLNIDAGLTSKTFEDFTRVDENVYESDDYDKAEKKIEIDLDLGVSSLTVTWR